MRAIRILATVGLLVLVSASCPPMQSVKADDAAGGALAESYRLQAKGDLAGAVRAMKAAAEAAPKGYFPRLRLAYLQLLAADYAGAAESYRQAGAIEPAAIEPLLGEQQAQNALERYDQAEKAGREALARDPRSYLGQSRLAWTLYRRKDFRGAAEMYAKVLALYPGDVDMRLGLANALLGAGEKTQASAAYRDLLAMVPGHADATAGLSAIK